jgi:hypothetical protein
MSYLAATNKIFSKTDKIEKQMTQDMVTIRHLVYDLQMELGEAMKKIMILEDALREYANEDLWNEYSIEDLGNYRTVWAFDLTVPDPTWTAREALRKALGNDDM